MPGEIMPLRTSLVSITILRSPESNSDIGTMAPSRMTTRLLSSGCSATRPPSLFSSRSRSAASGAAGSDFVSSAPSTEQVSRQTPSNPTCHISKSFGNQGTKEASSCMGMKTGRPGAVPDGMASTETNSEPLLKPKASVPWASSCSSSTAHSPRARSPTQPGRKFSLSRPVIDCAYPSFVIQRVVKAPADSTAHSSLSRLCPPAPLGATMTLRPGANAWRPSLMFIKPRRLTDRIKAVPPCNISVKRCARPRRRRPPP